MIKDSKKLTNGIIIYSVVVSEYEPLDFRNDALAGVRANYFNTNCAIQQETTDISIDGSNYKLSYLMKDNCQLSWKVSKNQRPYQSVKRSNGNIYSVLFYNENGNIYKRAYFDIQHNWIRTEYYDMDSSNRMVCKLSPINVEGIFALKCVTFSTNGDVIEKILYPSDKAPETICKSLVYSNSGMIWYDELFRPSDLKNEVKCDLTDKRFKFNPELFVTDEKITNVINLDNAEYLTEADNIIGSELNEKVENNIESDDKPYSAYEKIESILFEAQKTNKDLFGEILSHTFDEESFESVDTQSIPYDSVKDDSVDNQAENNNDELIDDSKDLPNETDLDDKVDLENKDFVIEEEPKSAVVINNNGGQYIYYGDVDSNNCRTGRGRTVSPNGTTSYDGYYSDDKRDGFGVCYYKNGEINYVGNWKQNIREGSGVGYRQSDSTMHAGRWSNNAPDGFGARFDGEGSFIDVCSYNCGVRDGISVSFDENGNVILAKWENGQKVSEKIVEVDL